MSPSGLCEAKERPTLRWFGCVQRRNSEDLGRRTLRWEVAGGRIDERGGRGHEVSRCERTEG